MTATWPWVVGGPADGHLIDSQWLSEPLVLVTAVKGECVYFRRPETIAGRHVEVFASRDASTQDVVDAMLEVALDSTIDPDGETGP